MTSSVPSPAPSSTPTRQANVLTVVFVVGWVAAGLLLLAAGWVRWIGTGPGSQSNGLDLADSLRRGVFSPDWGTWVALSVYSIVGLGGLFIATAPTQHRLVVFLRGIVCLACLVFFVVLGWVVLPIDNWAAGPTMATIAFFISTALSIAQLVASARK